MNTKEEVLAILNEIKPTIDLKEVDDIVDGGYLDSLELMILISTLMERFGFELDIEWVTPENFNSAEAIAALVDKIRSEEK